MLPSFWRNKAKLPHAGQDGRTLPVDCIKAYAICRACDLGRGIRMLSVGIVAALTLIGCVYLALTLRYFYRAPAIGIAIGTGCFAVARVLSLR